jgi:gliding motility-associated-like protein
MKKSALAILALLLFGAALSVKASHIAGAELVYSCSGNNMYTIRLKMYRDCDSQTPFDDGLTLYIFRGDGSVYDTFSLNRPPVFPVQPVNWSACVGSPYDICLEEGTYQLQVYLPPSPTGYNIAHTRCCRNGVITNLLDPECQGITFLARVPAISEANCNSMPVFNRTPSIFLCAGEPYFFDYSATDSDGDSLAYSISMPFAGTNLQGLGTGPQNFGGCSSSLPPRLSATNVMGPPAYTGVTYAPGYSVGNPFGPGSYATINPITGYLTAFPANLGIYVMAISVREYRNGVLLSENKRDFQFHVIACLPQGPPPVLTHNLGSLNVVNDTIYAEAGEAFCYTFDVIDPLLPSTIEVTPLSVSFGGNGGFPPPYATITTSGSTPPVTGTICWTPGCSYAGNLVPMIISARDVGDCPNYNIVFDTVWVRVLPPEVAPPVVTASTGSLPSNGDTIVLDVQQNFCFNFTVVDTAGGGSLIGQALLQDTLGNMLGQVHAVTTTISGDTLFGTVCWETFCNFGFTYMFVMVGSDESRCPPNNVNRDTIWLRIPAPYNPPPVVSSDISFQNPTNGDTILANVNENFCFDFIVRDTTNGLGEAVSFTVSIYDGSGALILDNPVTYSVFGTTDTIAGEICWTPRCPSVDQLITIILRGNQENACNQFNYDFDTIYVRVDEPIKPVPLISHDLGPNFPGNSLVEVEDDGQFCYNFELRDTVNPTYVTYSIKILDGSGTEFTTTSPPLLTYTFQSDSLLQGNICWQVPCDLADQTFTIVMTGRDTFDCRASNTVYDTVQIRHTENPPSALRFCNATVENDDSSITVTWDATIESDVVGFVLYRKRDDELAFVPIDTIYDLNARSFVDPTVVADDHAYAYQMLVIDRCGTQSILSEVIQTVLLQVQPVEYSSSLSWTPFIGWGVGPVQYDIWRGAPIDGGYPSELFQTVNVNTFTYIDAVVDRARLCYRVMAISDGQGCAERSQSNEACVNFPPTLFVPTGFTPNGDGLNDYFTSFGEFVASFEMLVYDRWGKLIFKSNDVRVGWNGSQDNSPAPEGVYVYKIKLEGYNGTVMEKDGSVTLIR